MSKGQRVGYVRVSSLDQKGSFTSYAIFNPGVTDKVAAAMKEELARAAKEGFTAQEIENARSAIMQEARVARSSDSAVAGSLANQLFLNRTYAFTADLETKIKAVTPEMARAALAK